MDTQNQNQPVGQDSTIQTNEAATESSSQVNKESPVVQKNKRWLYIGVILTIIILTISSIFFLNAKKNNKLDTTDEKPTPFLPEADPRIKVELTPKDKGKTVLLRVSNLPKDMTSLEYELKYKTDAKSEGVFGLIKLDSGADSVEREITLGTCSSGVCKYHNVTSKGQLTIKFNSSKGASRFQKEFDLL